MPIEYEITMKFTRVLAASTRIATSSCTTPNAGTCCSTVPAYYNHISTTDPRAAAGRQRTPGTHILLSADAEVGFSRPAPFRTSHHKGA
jgi:hypothetical protein